MPLSGQTMIESVLHRLSQQVDSILISANSNLDRYQSFGYRVVSDKKQGFYGPLSGMLSAFQTTRSDYLLVVPCDAPLLPLDLLARLQVGLLEVSASVAIAYDGTRGQPLFSLIKKQLGLSISEWLGSGERSVMKWVCQQNYTSVDFSDQPNAFLNINTPADLSFVKTHLQKVSTDYFLRNINPAINVSREEKKKP